MQPKHDEPPKGAPPDVSAEQVHALLKQVDTLERDNEHLHRDNSWLKSLAITRRGWGDPNNYIAVFTILMVIVVSWYTLETRGLRQEAHDQVQATYTQTETYAEQAIRPVVVLGTKDDFTVKPNQHTIIIRNVGPGPAFDTLTLPVTISHAKIPSGPLPTCLGVKEPEWVVSATTGGTMQLNHRTILAAGETQNIDGEEKVGDKTFRLTRDTCTEPYTRLTPVQSIERIVTGEQSQTICIKYRSAESKRYETWQKLYRPSGQSGSLAIDYICHRPTPNNVEQCSESVEKACGNQ